MANAQAAIENEVAEIGDLVLESGKTLPDVHIAYQRKGAADAPTILVCHALTGNQYTVTADNGTGWWEGLIGPGQYIDSEKYQVITTNVLGGCEGTTGPLSVNPLTGERYSGDFPVITIRDMVKAQKRLLEVLHIHSLHTVIGGSLGGMQVLEWGLLYPDMMDRLIPIAVTPALSDYAIGFNAIGRTAIVNDPEWNDGNYSSDTAPANGLGIARMIGMLTYRSGTLFNQRFQREQTEEWYSISDEASFSVETYLHYQAQKLSQRFDANSYLTLLKAMDSHDIGRGRGGIHQASKGYRAKMLCLGFTEDLLYPPAMMKTFTESVNEESQKALFHEVNTIFGHDGFLTEFEKWGPYLERFFSK